ncbi:hypothetical protein [Vibrio crassostreae]|uniref:hypothetical protein n=1 Tax=Vibrio crassostreae TaxID=246167 RepID=UPI001B315839|nr:hypothetical protein [Vibrio crassostreae]
MSLEQGQRGSYKFNKTNFPKVSIKFRKLFNEYHDFSHAVALGIYEILKSQKVKADDAERFIWDLPSNAPKTNFTIRKVLMEKKVRTDFELDQDLIEFIVAEVYRSQSNKNAILKPRRSAFPKITNKEKTFSIDFECRELSITVNESTQSVHWKIDQNNRNVDRVEQGFYGKLLFPVLSEHKWARGEGGYLKTIEENLDDSEYAERYNTSECAHYGTIGKEQKDMRHREMVARFR